MKDQTLAWKVLFLAVCISISACLQVFQQHFIYWRPVFFEEIWRWWSAHWVHVGWVHFLLNMIAFGCLPFIFPHTRTRYLMALLLSLPPLISITFYLDYPDIEAYAGLSGVLHGIYVAVAIYFLQFEEERKFALMVIGLVIAKIAWEITLGSFFTSQLIGSPVVIEAHYVGVIWGTLLSLLLIVYELYIGKVDRE